MINTKDIKDMFQVFFGCAGITFLCIAIQKILNLDPLFGGVASGWFSHGFVQFIIKKRENE